MPGVSLPTGHLNPSPHHLPRVTVRCFRYLRVLYSKRVRRARVSGIGRIVDKVGSVVLDNVLARGGGRDR
jgi:hypothetical protein